MAEEDIECLINQTGLDKESATELLHKNNGDIILCLYEFNNIDHNDKKEIIDDEEILKNNSENRQEINNKFNYIREILDIKDELYKKYTK